MRPAQRPADEQALFMFIWHDESDDRPDRPDDDLADDDPVVAPLHRHLRTRAARPAAGPTTCPRLGAFPHYRTPPRGE